jgi:hypothetical protein
MRVIAAIIYTWLICGGMVVVLASNNQGTYKVVGTLV